MNEVYIDLTEGGVGGMTKLSERGRAKAERGTDVLPCREIAAQFSAGFWHFAKAGWGFPTLQRTNVEGAEMVRAFRSGELVGSSYGAGLSVGVRTGGFRGFLKVLSKMTYTIGIRTSSNVGIYQNPRYENEVGLCL